MGQAGRPRTFDRDAALDAAMMMFWSRGFEQTSVDELAAAMGVRTSSLYAAFGDKETLFLSAIDRYRQGRGSVYDSVVINARTALEAVERLFEVSVRELTRTDQPSFCMLCLAMPTCSPSYDHLQRELDRLRALSDQVLLEKLRDGVHNKELPESTDLKALTSFFRTVLWGMSLRARAGAKKKELLQAGKLAMQVWPVSDSGARTTHNVNKRDRASSAVRADVRTA